MTGAAKFRLFDIKMDTSIGPNGGCQTCRSSNLMPQQIAKVRG